MARENRLSAANLSSSLRKRRLSDLEGNRMEFKVEGGRKEKMKPEL